MNTSCAAEQLRKLADTLEQIGLDPELLHQEMSFSAAWDRLLAVPGRAIRLVIQEDSSISPGPKITFGCWTGTCFSESPTLAGAVEAALAGTNGQCLPRLDALIARPEEAEEEGLAF